MVVSDVVAVKVVQAEVGREGGGLAVVAYFGAVGRPCSRCVCVRPCSGYGLSAAGRAPVAAGAVEAGVDAAAVVVAVVAVARPRSSPIFLLVQC